VPAKAIIDANLQVRALERRDASDPIGKFIREVTDEAQRLTTDDEDD
jgi:hypothetical protein